VIVSLDGYLELSSEPFEVKRGETLTRSFALARVMAGLVVGISTRDPLTFSLGSLALFLIALLASYAPALRASRVAPSDALRS